MSTFVDATVTCRSCGTQVDQPVATSVNAIRSPWLRQAILDDTFQRQPCPSCGDEMVIIIPFLYVDFEQKILIGAYPQSQIESWAECEHEAQAAFQRNVVESPSEFVRGIAADVRVRTVFGLHALREKITILEQGLDDAAIEAAKLQVLVSRDDIRRDRDAPLYLLEAGPQELRFAVEVGHDGAWSLDVATVDRAVYERMASGEVEELLVTLRAGPFRDRRRLLLDEPSPVTSA